MEKSYLLAKKLVSKRYKSNDSLYQIMLVTFTTLFYKYKDYSDIVEKVFNDTDVFISKESVKEILERENINISIRLYKKELKNKEIGYAEVFYKNKSIHKEPIYKK